MSAIHNGALTNSKRPECFVQGIYPTHVIRGDGCYLFDVDGKKYIDFITALGTNLVGYANQQINDAIFKQLYKGTVFSLSSTIEVEAAEKLKELFPFVGKMRFLKTGSDAAAAAIKIARAHHGVCYDNESMYRLLGNKEFTRISQSSGPEDWIQREMQSLYQEISEGSKNIRNKEIGTAEVCTVGKGEKDRSQAQPNTSTESEAIGASGSLSTSQTQSKKAAMYKMWSDRFTGTSPRLLETTGCGVALPETPRRTPPRTLILSDGYHGHNCEFIGLTKPRLGVIPDPYVLPLVGNEDLISIAAAVIIEPIITDFSKERSEYLIRLKEKCNKTGTLLIFDEIITGFRFPNYSFSNYSGIHPDIILLGKAIGGGMPLSVVATKPGIGENADWFISSTFAGDTIALAAMLKLIELLKNNYKLSELWEYGQRFIDGFNSIAPGVIKIDGYPTRGVFVADQKNKALFFQEACKAGMLFGPSFFYNFNHMPLNEIVLSSCTDIINRIKNNQVELEGEMPKAPFAQKVRESK